MDGNEPEKRSLRIELAPRSIVYVLLAVLGVWVAWQLWTVFVVVAIALVMVGTLDPMVAWLEKRGLGRGRALALIFILITLVIAAAAFASIPPLLSQLQKMIEDLPKQRQKLIDWMDQYKSLQSFSKTVKEVPVNDIVARAANVLLGYGQDLLIGFGYAITTTFLAIYLLADPRSAKSMLYAFVPRHHHVKTAKIILELKVIVGGYMRGQVITSVAAAIFMFVLMTVLGVEDALAIAVFAGLTDVIPFVGGYVASAPAVIAVAGRGSATMIVVAILCILYQEFESRILVPRVYGRTLRLSPAVVLVSLLVGGSLLGILGAFLALPISAGLQMIVRELRVDLPGEEPEERERMRRSDEKAERLYERLTEGAPVGEAAEIAGELAEKIKETEQEGGSLTQEMAALAPTSIGNLDPTTTTVPDRPKK